MIRPYLTDGTLLTRLAPSDNTAQVDAITWTYLNSTLGVDYCYLVVGGAELVKVVSTQAPNILLLARVKSSSRTVWPAGTSITYQPTIEEVLDAVVVSTLNIVATGAINTVGMELNYPTIQIAALGGISSSSNAINAAWTLENIEGSDCHSCDPPNIPLNYEKVRITDSAYRITDDGSYRSYG